MGKDFIEKVISEQGETLTDNLLKSLSHAESSLELLTHLNGQMKANRIRSLGTGPSNKTIIFIRNRLVDDFSMTEEQIETELKKINKEF